jgi:hypothetical protein
MTLSIFPSDRAVPRGIAETRTLFLARMSAQVGNFGGSWLPAVEQLTRSTNPAIAEAARKMLEARPIEMFGEI